MAGSPNARVDGRTLRPEIHYTTREQHSPDVQLLFPVGWPGIGEEDVRIRGAIAMTLWKPGEPVTLLPASTPVELLDRIYCSEGGPARLAAIRPGLLFTCRAPFRWLDLRLTREFQEGYWVYQSSHSPFPSGIDMNARIERMF